MRGIQDSLRAMFNPHFGSTFRSHNNPTYFSRKLFRFINDIYALKEKPYNIIHRFSDIYTSRVTNLLQYSLNHSFYPRSEILVCCCHQFLFFSQEGVCLLLSRRCLGDGNWTEPNFFCVPLLCQEREMRRRCHVYRIRRVKTERGPLQG